MEVLRVSSVRPLNLSTNLADFVVLNFPVAFGKPNWDFRSALS
jgi:hypothetical protein